MSDYSKSTNFTAKDGLASGDPNKRINGALFDSEFDPISTAVASKIDKVAGETAEISQFTSSGGLESTGLTLTQLYGAIYPVGSIYSNAAVATNPATLLGFGTWTAFGAGRVMVGLDSGNVLMDTVEETGGSADAVVIAHTHTVTDPGHIHSVSGTRNYNSQDDRNGSESTRLGQQVDTDSATTGITIASAGVAGTDLNYQPFITVYYWKRTA